MPQRAAGKTFAGIAKSYGVSESALLAEATRLETAELDAAVKAGQITEAQKTQYLAGLQERLQAALTSTDAVPVGGPGGPGGDGDGPHGGVGSCGTGNGANGANGATTPTTTPCTTTSSLMY